MTNEIDAVTLLASRHRVKDIARIMTGMFKLGTDGYLQSASDNGHRRLNLFVATFNTDTGEELVTLYGVPMGSGTSSTTSRYTSMLEHAQAVADAFYMFSHPRRCHVHFLEWLAAESTAIRCVTRRVMTVMATALLQRYSPFQLTTPLPVPLEDQELTQIVHEVCNELEAEPLDVTVEQQQLQNEVYRQLVGDLAESVRALADVKRQSTDVQFRLDTFQRSTSAQSAERVAMSNRSMAATTLHNENMRASRHKQSLDLQGTNLFLRINSGVSGHEIEMGAFSRHYQQLTDIYNNAAPKQMEELALLTQAFNLLHVAAAGVHVSDQQDYTRYDPSAFSGIPGVISGGPPSKRASSSASLIPMQPSNPVVEALPQSDVGEPAAPATNPGPVPQDTMTGMSFTALLGLEDFDGPAQATAPAPLVPQQSPIPSFAFPTPPSNVIPAPSTAAAMLAAGSSAANAVAPNSGLLRGVLDGSPANILPSRIPGPPAASPPRASTFAWAPLPYVPVTTDSSAAPLIFRPITGPGATPGSSAQQSAGIPVIACPSGSFPRQSLIPTILNPQFAVAPSFLRTLPPTSAAVGVGATGYPLFNFLPAPAQVPTINFPAGAAGWTPAVLFAPVVPAPQLASVPAPIGVSPPAAVTGPAATGSTRVSGTDVSPVADPS